MSAIAPKRGGHKRKRKFPGVKGKRPDRKEQRRAEALERAAGGGR